MNNYELTASSGKNLEDIDHAQVVSLLYKLITSARDTDDMSFGFDRDRGRRQRELTDNKNIEGKYHVWNMLRDSFGFPEYQEKATYGLGYKLTLTRLTDNVVLIKDNTINKAKIKIKAIEWYVPHYTLSVSNQAMFCDHILTKVPTELQFVERSVFMKEANTESLWTSELGTEEGKNRDIRIYNTNRNIRLCFSINQ